MSEGNTPMLERNNTKCIVIGLIFLIAFFFAVGASRFEESRYNGRFQLVVRHTDEHYIYVHDP